MGDVTFLLILEIGKREYAENINGRKSREKREIFLRGERKHTKGFLRNTNVIKVRKMMRTQRGTRWTRITGN